MFIRSPRFPQSIFALALLFTLPLCQQAHAQTQIKGIAQFDANDGISNNFFGGALAFNDTHLVVGAQFDNTNGTNAGAAYLFDTQTQTNLFTLLAPDGQAGDLFGKSVAIYNDLIVIGSENNHQDLGEQAGAVYLFDATTGLLIEKITPDDALDFNRFGFSVAVNEEFIVIGAYSDDNIFLNSGSVYLYDTTTHQLVTKLVGNDPLSSRNFGSSVAIHEQTLAVGAISDDEIDNDTGAIYIFNLATMTQSHKLVPKDIGIGDQIGSNVTLTDGLVAFGVPLSDTNGDDTGVVYIFNTDTGSQEQRFFPSNQSPDDRFGYSVSMDDEFIIIGARKFDFDDFPYDETNAGTAYVFDTSTGLQLARLVPDEIFDSAGDSVGEAVAIHNGIVMVGALHNNEHNLSAGTVHLFNIQGLTFTDWAYYPDDFEFPNKFGHSIAVDSHYMVVGAPHDQAGALRGGAAYIFDTNTNQLLHQLIPPGVGFNMQYGTSVSINNKIAAIGAPLTFVDGNQNAGKVYLYDVDTGNLIHILSAADPEIGALLGHSVSIHNGIVVTGAYGHDENGSSSGVAYTFDAISGQQLAKLVPLDGDQNEHFGSSIAVHSNHVIVGAVFGDNSANATGAAYLFNASTGTQLNKIVSLDPGSLDYFGQSVAINNNTIAVGAARKHSGINDSGSVYLYDRKSRAQIAKLEASDPTAQAQFGWSVALNDTQLLVGIRRPEFPSESPDKAYLFDLDSLSQLTTILPTDGTIGDRFGTAVALTNSIAAIGASNEFEQSDDSGTAYTLSIAPPICIADFTNDGIIDFFDVSAFLQLFNNQDPQADLTNDGIINFFDISTFLQLFPLGCP